MVLTRNSGPKSGKLIRKNKEKISSNPPSSLGSLCYKDAFMPSKNKEPIEEAVSTELKQINKLQEDKIQNQIGIYHTISGFLQFPEININVQKNTSLSLWPEQILYR